LVRRWNQEVINYLMPQSPSRKVKVFRLIARLNTGGPARHVVWLTAGLPEDEFETVLVCGTVPPGEGDMSYFAAENGVEPRIIPEMSRELSPKDVVSLWKVYRQICRDKPHIIHTHTAKAGTLGRVAGFFYKWLTPAALVGRPRRVRFVHTYHGHVFHSYYGRAKTLFFLTVERVLAFLATDRILVLSEQQRREIHEAFKVGRAAQFRIVPLGIDLQIFQNRQERRHILREELKADDDEILVGIVGRLTEVKNHSLFLRAAKLWQERQNENSPRVRFVIIGDGHLREPLEKEAVELGLTDKTLVFAGERKDPHVFYPALDVVALTSHNEGTPLTLIEAMANARPVISTAVGGVADLLGTKQFSAEKFEIAERGIAVEPNNSEAFYAGLKEIVENHRLRDKLSNVGEVFITKNYSKKRLLADIENLYRELLQPKVRRD
jgi:glycosyltransferase involved in cell wall biosynthesis